MLESCYPDFLIFFNESRQALAKGLSDGYKITDCDFRWIFFLLRREGKLEMEYIIDACSGKSMNVSAGQKVRLLILKADKSLIFLQNIKKIQRNFYPPESQ